MFLRTSRPADSLCLVTHLSVDASLFGVISSALAIRAEVACGAGRWVVLFARGPLAVGLESSSLGCDGGRHPQIIIGSGAFLLVPYYTQFRLRAAGHVLCHPRENR